MAASAPVPAGREVPSLLADRVLLQVNHRSCAPYVERVDPSAGGLVLVGDGALTKAGNLRAEGFDAAVLVDQARYQDAYATVDAPFPGLDDGPVPLFGDPLEHLMLTQLAFADAALTPTGYVRAGALDVLEAAAARVARIGDPRVVFTVPVDASWLYPGAVERLAEVLSGVPGPAAVVVGGRPDLQVLAAGLVRLLALAPGTGVLRTGLAAFGALAHGAGFTGFGVTGSMRHVVSPDVEREVPPGGPASPVVLFPQLMHFFLGESLAKRFAEAGAPSCECVVCGGELLDRFTSRADGRAAAGHNAAVLTQWVQQCDAVGGSGRAAWWQERCRQALDGYAQWNAHIRVRRGFVAPTDLPFWAADLGRRPVAAPAG